jgi:TrmH family RNA methyltransferase
MALPASTLKKLRSLSRKRDREKAGLLLAEGQRLVQEAILGGAAIECAYYTEEARRTSAAFIRDLRQAAGESAVITRRELESVSDVVTSQGVLALVRWHPVEAATLLSDSPNVALLVACDGLSDPGNMGSLLRTCAWFGVHGVLLGAGCVEVSNPKVVRGSMGAVFRLQIAREVDLPAALASARRSGYLVYGTDAAAPQRHDRAEFAARAVVVLGNEAHGLSTPVREETDLLLQIPRYGQAESLNVAVACGIILATARSRRSGA